MTTDEKAKAYDEALERAKNIKSKILQSHLSTESCKAVSEYIDEIIPELRESKDERIRKALIDALKVSETIGELKFRLPYSTREECIAYLEKQKEQKPVEWSEEDEEALDMCLDVVPKKWKTKSGILLTKWLKDKLRPSWKPSEEQMKALKAVIDSPTQYQCIVNELKPLYNELKKL